MARNKGDRPTEKSTMQNNPFKTLKGFCVSPAEEKSASKKHVPAPAAAEEGPVGFAGEMERLGVQRLDDSDAAGESVPLASQPVAEPAPPSSDEELFVASLGRLDTVFTDNLPGDDEIPASAPRRMKQLRQGKLAPEATLDLHGLHRDAAREKVRYFLENGVYHGRRTVLIVTGRGLGSEEGAPVLRGEVERFLDGEGRAWVAEWGRAPKQYGGDGALVAFLRSDEKRS